MELIAGLSVGVLVAISLMISIKIFGVWLRSRQLPELLLSLMLLAFYNDGIRYVMPWVKGILK